MVAKRQLVVMKRWMRRKHLNSYVYPKTGGGFKKMDDLKSELIYQRLKKCVNSSQAVFHNLKIREYPFSVRNQFERGILYKINYL